MDANQLTEKLMCFGLTRQEATLYLCLAQNGEMTGYEAAKQTGISRSNAYNALAGLVDKGAAYTAEGTALRYHMVETEEFCRNKIRALEKTAAELTACMPRQKTQAQGYLTITGDIHIRDKISNMITGAGERVYLSMTYDSLMAFCPEIREAVAAGRKIVAITDKAADLSGVIVYQTAAKGRQVGVIAYSAYALSGELGGGDDSTCLYSGQENFVRVFKDSLRNEIILIQLKQKGDY